MTDDDSRRNAPDASGERLRQQLQQQVAERTAQLAFANHELEAFSYSVAHDLRAPLRLIHAHVQMLRAYRGPGDAREPQIHLEQIQRGVQEMSALIDGLLALSSVSHAPLQPRRIPLGSLLAQCLQQLQPDMQGRDIDWRIGELPVVEGDPDLLQQAFIHLLGNALKYSQPRARAIIEIGIGVGGAAPIKPATDGRGSSSAAPGRSMLETAATHAGQAGTDGDRPDAVLSRHPLDGASQEARTGERYVYVRDNGVGFDMGHAGKLFGIFQRLHRQDEFAGTGVGLATVQRIIQRHGGRIWAQGAPGRGAQFCFTLPGLEAASV